MQLHKKYITFLIILISSLGFGQSKLDKLLRKWNTRNIPYMSVETLSLPKTKAILLDARQTKEYEVSHLKNAIHVGYKDFNLKSTLEELSGHKEDTIVVYCSIGIRSETIAYKLKKEGYPNVFNLYGGIFEWKNKGFHVVNGKGEITEKVHTFNKQWSKWLIHGEKIYE